MRKFLALLLVLLLCAFGAAAEGLQTEGEFDYFVQDLPWMETKSVLIMGYHLPEGQDYVFIPMEVGGYPVAAADLQGVPESVKTVYAYQSNSGILPPVGRELTEILYLNYALVQANADYKAKLPNMAEGDIALAEAARIRRGEDNMPVQSAMPAAEVANLDFPQELGGRKVHHNILTNVTTEPGMTFASRPGGRAEIVDIRLAEGQNYVFIPDYWNGMAVYVEGETIPEQVEVVYAPWSIIPPAEGRTLTEVFYVSDEDAKQYSDVKDLQPGDIVLMDIRRFRTENGELVEEGSYYEADHRIEPGIPYVKAENFPKELDGHRVNATALGTGAFAELAGDCRYYVSAYNGSPTIVDTELPEGAKEIVIPKDMEGDPYYWIHPSVLGADIHTIYLPYGSYGISLKSPEEDRVLCLVYYADYETVMADEILKQRFADMGENDWVLVDARLHFENAEKMEAQERIIRFEADALPSELRGHRVDASVVQVDGLEETVSYQQALRGEFDGMMHLIDLNMPDRNTIFYADVWGYSLSLDEYGKRHMEIKDCTAPEGTKELVIPPELDGYSTKNVGLDIAFLPESLETIYVMGDYGLWSIMDGEGSNRKLTQVTYMETASKELEWVSASTHDYATGQDVPWYEAIIPAENLPKEIAGREVLLPDWSYDFMRTEGDWGYIIVDIEGKKEAYILKYLGEDTPTFLSAPSKLGGCPVKTIIYSALPESVEMVFVQGHSTGILDYGEHNGEVLLVSYGNINKDEVELKEVFKYIFTKGVYRGENGSVLVEDLPKEIDGKTVRVPHSSCYTYTSGEWTYYLSDDGRGIGARVTQSQLPEGITELTVPKELDGYPVQYIDTAAIPQSVKTVTIPKDAFVREGIGGARPGLKIVQEKN